MEMYAYEMGAEAPSWAEDGEFNGFSLTEYFKAKRKADKIEAHHGAGAYVFEDPTRVSEFLEMLRGKLTEQMKVQVVAGQKAAVPVRGARLHRRDQALGLVHGRRRLLLRDARPARRAPVLLRVRDRRRRRTRRRAGRRRQAAGRGRRSRRRRRRTSSGSITLSCGKLMTGVTVREWGAILMLRSLKSPESYFQAAFRVQSPWAYRDADGAVDVRKATCYVFEFDPNRALGLVAEYGMRLATTGDADTRSRRSAS